MELRHVKSRETMSIGLRPVWRLYGWIWKLLGPARWQALSSDWDLKLLGPDGPVRPWILKLWKREELPAHGQFEGRIVWGREGREGRRSRRPGGIFGPVGWSPAIWSRSLLSWALSYASSSSSFERGMEEPADEARLEPSTVEHAAAGNLPSSDWSYEFINLMAFSFSACLWFLC